MTKESTVGTAIFDLDGTLIDTAPLCAEILTAMLVDRGIREKISGSQARSYVTRGGLSMIEALIGRHGGDPQADLAEFRDRYRVAPTPIESLFPGALEALEQIRDSGTTLAIWSNKPQDLCEKATSETGLRKYFTAVVGTGPTVPLKPDPTGLDVALSLSGGSRSRCVYVGDSDVDYEAARAVDVPFLMIECGYGRYCSKWQRACLVESFPLLPSLVESALGSLAST